MMFNDFCDHFIFLEQLLSTLKDHLAICVIFLWRYMEMQKKTNVYLIDDSAMILWLVSAHISKWLALFQPLGE